MDTSNTENFFADLVKNDGDEASISFGDDQDFITRQDDEETVSTPIVSEASSYGLEQNESETAAPDFSDLFEDEGPKSNASSTSEQFQTFPELLTEKPQPLFANQNYYKMLLHGEGDVAKRVHQLLGNFLKAQDPQDRSMHRGRLTPAFWDLATNIAMKSGQKLSAPKVLLLRFGILLPTAISADQRLLISRIPFQTRSDAPVFYADQWLSAIANGEVSASATDETKTTASDKKGQKRNALLEKTQGKYDAQLQVVKNLMSEVRAQESRLMEKVDILQRHESLPQYGGIPAGYNTSQREGLSEANNIIRRLSNLNRQVGIAYNELNQVHGQLDQLKDEVDGFDEHTIVDNKIVGEEMNTLRQMAKLCVGRQGNHFPMLMKQYFIPNIRDIGTKENVINILAEVEHLDPDIFKRTFKQQTNRIVPNIILIPCYGDSGICWEPFERHARATSRGRVAIPLFPKDLKVAIISALGDLRWQVAKERAQHYWMEEGLTGWYYQDFSDKKKKGDVKDAFIQDYVLWLTKEAEGTQKLEKEVRDIFWRYVPFPQDVKDKLRNRGFVYNELYKKDVNRSMSDGY